MRCEYCGTDQRIAIDFGRTHCAPPFEVQPHAFNGKHPADVLEKKRSSKIAALGRPRINPGIGAHMATVNLFREPDGTYELTVAEARGFIDGWQGERMRAAPIYYIERAIIEAADKIKARHGL